MKKIDLKLGDIKEPLPKKLINKIQKQAFKDINLYPQNVNFLISRLARKHQVKTENIILTNGADEGIELILRVFGQNTLIFSPTYYEFLDAPKRNHLKVEWQNCFDGLKYSLKYQESDIKNRTLIFLCNPNNPFGLIAPKEIIRIAKKTKGIVAVDETYIDFGGQSVIEKFKSVPNLLILRTFSKGYELAGLRIGYVLGNRNLIKKIAQIKIMYNVNSIAINTALIALVEKKYFQQIINKIKKTKKDFEKFLKNRKFQIIDSQTNKIFIKFPSAKKAGQFYKFLTKHGVVINQGNGFGTCGLDKTYIQFSCGTVEQMQQLKKIVTKYHDSHVKKR